MAWGCCPPRRSAGRGSRAAVASYYTHSPVPKDPDGKLWILPHHVRTLRTKIRSARLENFQY